ncbi:hypothetical protein ACI5KX_00380 [Erythrobacter sp. GH1-10]|uniref:hypothetical protein n=1 Tax=Erythrobacter sp. GH1-10 TaxID=3349334 RepID=UPI003877EA7E
MIATIPTIAVLLFAAFFLNSQSKKTGDPQRAKALLSISAVFVVIAFVLAIIVGVEVVQEYILV